MKFFNALLGIFFLFLIACKPADDSATESEDTNQSAQATFVANPQQVPEQEVETLALGEKAPDFNLPNVDGRFYTLDDFSDSQILLVIFTCNHCPTAQAYEDRIIRLQEDYNDKGVALVAISPNSPLGLLYEELGYTDLGDTYEDMQVRAQEMAFDFPYLYDGDDHKTSLKYGPVATPHAFIFDQERKLRYVGRIDASEKPGTANADDVRAALNALLAGEEVQNAQTKTFGCSTKWAWKTSYKEKLEKEWSEKTATVEMLDVQGVKKLLQNDSDKLRLINIWATWCGPCVIEYPEFIIMQRMFGARDFEFVSLSADKVEAKDDVLKFLNEKNSAVPNYQFSGGDIYELVEAVDPDWNAALPYTILVEPGGKKVYAKQGTIDPFQLKKTIVEHPMIGRYY